MHSHPIFVVIVCLFAVVGFELKVSYLLAGALLLEPCHQPLTPFFKLLVIFQLRSGAFAQAGLPQ
jgi:hypothetical protein